MDVHLSTEENIRMETAHSAFDMPSRHVILSDFDGTITHVNVLDLIFAKFGSPICRQINEQWIRGEISSREEMSLCFATVNASKKEIESLLSTVEIESSLHEFLAFCKQHSHEFAIVSDGFKWYIDFILHRHGIQGVKTFANEILFDSDGIKLEFPWYEPEFASCGVSKPGIIRDYQRNGYRVTFIGDGQSDRDAIFFADRIFARGELLEYSQKHGIQATPFSSLGDILINLSDDMD
jgi:2-hydroxy-3-keto-5-methylthiopentenyl-1-phosphate phosphatase